MGNHDAASARARTGAASDSVTPRNGDQARQTAADDAVELAGVTPAVRGDRPRARHGTGLRRPRGGQRREQRDSVRPRAAPGQAWPAGRDPDPGPAERAGLLRSASPPGAARATSPRCATRPTPRPPRSWRWPPESTARTRRTSRPAWPRSGRSWAPASRSCGTPSQTQFWDRSHGSGVEGLERGHRVRAAHQQPHHAQ